MTHWPTYAINRTFRPKHSTSLSTVIVPVWLFHSIGRCIVVIIVSSILCNVHTMWHLIGAAYVLYRIFSRYFATVSWQSKQPSLCHHSSHEAGFVKLLRLTNVHFLTSSGNKCTQCISQKVQPIVRRKVLHEIGSWCNHILPRWGSVLDFRQLTTTTYRVAGNGSVQSSDRSVEQLRRTIRPVHWCTFNRRSWALFCHRSKYEHTTTKSLL